MRFLDRLRQIFAGLTSGAAFMGLHWGVEIVWWAAFIMALVIYFGLVMLLPRYVPAEAIVLSGTTTRADLQEAAFIMDRAAERLMMVQPRLPEMDRETVETMIGYLQGIRMRVARDADHHYHTRRLISTHLKTMVETIERYADFAERSHGQSLEKLAPLTSRIAIYVKALFKIEKACSDNDLDTLEKHMDALEMEMRR